MYLYVQLHSLYALQWLLCIWHQHVYIMQHSLKSCKAGLRSRSRYVQVHTKYVLVQTQFVLVCTQYILLCTQYVLSAYSVQGYARCITRLLRCSDVAVLQLGLIRVKYKLCAYLVWPSAVLVRTQV
jgi:hypothetical protein